MDNGKEPAEDLLTLHSQLGEMPRLSAWIEGIAARHSLPKNLKFAITLCLEESISNIIRHGYADRKDGPIVVHFPEPHDNNFAFVVEDEAPLFNPLDVPEPSPLQQQKEIRIGGQGIRLMRRLAGTLAYEPTPAGNRLKMTFSIAGPLWSDLRDSRAGVSGPMQP